MLKARSNNSTPPIIEKLKSDFAASLLPRRQPLRTASMLIKKVSSAVSKREYSAEAAPSPAAALSKESASPREKASFGERTSISVVLASSGLA